MNDDLRDLPDLSERLHRLADRAVADPVPPADDLARGRRRLARRRALMVVGAAAATAAVVAAVAVRPGEVRAIDPADPTPAVPTGTASATGTAAPSPAVVRVEPSDMPRPGRQDHLGLGRSHAETLQEWNDVLAEHLDPDRAHLGDWDHNEQSGSDAAGLTELGSRYPWTVEGESGLGQLALSVNASWEGVHWDCGTASWDCRDADVRGLDGATRAQVARHNGVVEVAVEHADGGVVVLTADPLFGNNSLTPVSSMDLTERALLEAAADARLDLPGERPPSANPIDREAFRRTTLRTVVPPGVEAVLEEAGTPDPPYLVYALVRDGQTLGRLTVDAGRTGPADEPACFSAQFRRCWLHTVPGQDDAVLEGVEQQQWGGGEQVIRVGPDWTVRVLFRPTAGQPPAGPLDVEALVAFVSDPAWQTGRPAAGS